MRALRFTVCFALLLGFLSVARPSGAPPLTMAPASYKIIRGTLESGDESNLASSDGSKLDLETVRKSRLPHHRTQILKWIAEFDGMPTNLADSASFTFNFVDDTCVRCSRTVRIINPATHKALSSPFVPVAHDDDAQPPSPHTGSEISPYIT